VYTIVIIRQKQTRNPTAGSLFN